MLLYRDVSDYVSSHQAELAKGKPVTIVYRRDGQKMTADVVAKADEAGQYKLGIVGSNYYREKVGAGGSFLYGAAEVRFWIRSVFMGLRSTASAALSPTALSMS